MDRSSVYFRQVQLLMQVLPLVTRETCFALKGGTAINLFERNMPRLSVDLDLVYLPRDDRQIALSNSREALKRIAVAIEIDIRGTIVQRTPDHSQSLRLLVIQGSVRIKIELSPVLRGHVFPIRQLAVSERVEETFGYAESQVLSFEDLFAGKICAALDRQHPRDLFDIKLLLENERLTPNLKKTFLVYLISHNRPMAELLSPTLLNIRDLFAGEFEAMTEQAVTIKQLEDAREQLIEEIHNTLSDDERAFLVSIKNLSPNWSLLGLEGVADLPAVRWKLLNLGKMPKDKRHAARIKLEKMLLARGH